MPFVSTEMPQLYATEWQDALRFLDVPELADFLESTTPRARRMKISSPFLPLVD